MGDVLCILQALLWILGYNTAYARKDFFPHTKQS